MSNPVGFAIVWTLALILVVVAILVASAAPGTAWPFIPLALAVALIARVIYVRLGRN